MSDADAHARRIAKRILLTVIAIILGAIGLAGLPDDLTVWKTWIQASYNSIDSTVGRWVLVVVAVVLVVSANVPWRRWLKLRQKDKRLKGLSTIKTFSFVDLLSKSGWGMRHTSKHHITEKLIAIEDADIDQKTAVQLECGDTLASMAFDPPLDNLRAVEIACRNARGSEVSLQLIVSSPGKSVDERASLSVALSKQEPEQTEACRWRVCGTSRNLGDAWKSIVCDVRKSFGATFGKQGYALKKITGLHITGNAELARIQLYKTWWSSFIPRLQLSVFFKSRKRIEEVRQAFIDLANSAPTLESYSEANHEAWCMEARTMFEKLLGKKANLAYSLERPIEGNSEGENKARLRAAVGLVRSVAMQLKEDDLAD